MKFETILLEAAIENYKRDLEQYLDGRSDPYDFPYYPGATVSFEKSYAGDYGYVLNVVVRKEGRVAASAKVMERRVLYYNSNGKRVDVEETIPDPPSLFGRMVEIM